MKTSTVDRINPRTSLINYYAETAYYPDDDDWLEEYDWGDPGYDDRVYCPIRNICRFADSCLGDQRYCDLWQFGDKIATLELLGICPHLVDCNFAGVCNGDQAFCVLHA